MPPSVIIVGGGVIGCAAAYYLSGAGCSVTLYERATIAAEASGAAAGMLAPLAEAPEPGPFLDLAVAGLRAFQEDAAAIEAVSGHRIEYVPSGILRTAASRDQAATLQRSLLWAAEQGLPAAWLDAPKLGKTEPELSPALAGGLLSLEEGHVRPPRLTQALAQGAARRGARILEGVSVSRLLGGPADFRAFDRLGSRALREGPRPADGPVGNGFGRDAGGVVLADGTIGHADVVLLCGGAWSALTGGAPPLAAMPVRGQYIILRALPQPIRRVIYGDHIYAVPRTDGTIYVGATEEPEAAFRKAVTADGVRGLLERIVALVPALAGAEVVSTGAGLRPGSPDGLPGIGWVPGRPGLAVATGHYRNGVLLSLITGRLLAELIVHGRTSIDLAPFSPGRFEGAALSGGSPAESAS